MYDADQRDALADELAEAFLTAPWRRDAVAESGAARLDRWPGWMEALAVRVIAVYPAPPFEREYELVALIESFLAEHAPWPGEAEPPQIMRLLVSDRTARGGRLNHEWPIAEIDSVVGLAERLELSHGQLAWLADVRGLERSVADEKLRNYRYRVVPRRGGVPRVLEAPKARLKEIQRWILHEILESVPPHEAAQGFTRGRSVTTHAGLHTGRAVVLRFDLKDFFASVTAARVFGIFCSLGYHRS